MFQFIKNFIKLEKIETLTTPPEQQEQPDESMSDSKNNNQIQEQPDESMSDSNTLQQEGAEQQQRQESVDQSHFDAQQIQQVQPVQPVQQEIVPAPIHLFTTNGNMDNIRTGPLVPAPVLDTTMYRERSQAHVGKPYDSLREQLYNSLPIPVKVLPVVACETEILEYESFFERPWPMVEKLTIADILEPFGNFKTTTSTRQRYGKILFLSRIITKYSLSGSNYDAAIICHNGHSENLLYKAFKIFGFNYERISTHSPGRGVFGIIVKVRKNVENPEDFRPIKGSGVDVIYIFDSACKMDLTKEFELFQGVHSQYPDLVYLVSMDCAEIRLHTYNRFIDAPEKMVTWDMKIGDLDKDLLQILLLQPDRKPNSVFCHGWTDYLTTTFFNWSKSKSPDEEFEFKFPAKGAVLTEVINFKIHHPTGKPNDPQTQAITTGPPPPPKKKIAPTLVAPPCSGGPSSSKAAAKKAKVSAPAQPSTPSPPKVKKASAPGPSATIIPQATAVPSKGSSSSSSKYKKPYTSSLDVEAVSNVQSGLMDAMRTNALHMGRPPHHQQPYVGAPPYHYQPPFFADTNPVTGRSNNYYDGGIGNNMAGSSHSSSSYNNNMMRPAAPPVHLQSTSNNNNIASAATGSGIHPARLAMMMQQGTQVNPAPPARSAPDHMDWSGATGSNASAMPVKRERSELDDSITSNPSKFARTDASSTSYDNQAASSSTSSVQETIDNGRANTQQSNTQGSSTTSSNSISNIGGQLGAEYSDTLSEMFAKFEKDVSQFNLKL